MNGIASPRTARGTVTIAASDVARLFGNALLFAAPKMRFSDKRLLHIRLLSRPTRVWVVGVDPYTVAVDYAEPIGPACAFDMTVQRDVAEQLVVEARGLLRNVRGKQKEPDKYRFTFTDGDEMRNGCSVASIMQTRTWSEPAGWPKGMYDVFPKGSAEPITRVAFSPSLLMRFAKVEPRGIPMDMTFRGSLAGVEIAMGPRFRALLMPVRTPTPKAPDAAAGEARP